MEMPKANARWALLKKGDKGSGYGAATLTSLGFKAGDEVIVANRYGQVQAVTLVEVARVDAANPMQGKAEEQVWTVTKV